MPGFPVLEKSEYPEALASKLFLDSVDVKGLNPAMAKQVKLSARRPFGFDPFSKLDNHQK